MALRLARVLRLRTQLRERAQDETARARAALVAAHEALAAARATRDAACAAGTAALDGLTGAELWRFRAFEEESRTREQRLARESARLADEVVCRRQALLARQREERQLERLRERAREHEEVPEERATMVLLDDLALRRRSERR